MTDTYILTALILKIVIFMWTYRVAKEKYLLSAYCKKVNELQINLLKKYLYFQNLLKSDWKKNILRWNFKIETDNLVIKTDFLSAL